MKIFLDVGSHTGETLDEVVKPYHGFDVIYAFEPSNVCFKLLQEKYPGINLCNIGLSNASGEIKLYDPGSDGASVYQDKVDLHNKDFEIIRTVEASEWITNNTSPDDIIYMKLNCEGSECDIIENLIHKCVYDRIAHIMIDFDVRKIPSQRHRENDILRLLMYKKNYHLCNDVMIGISHQDRIRNWLSRCEL